MRRLTARQKAFIDAYLAGSTPSEAYKSAYNASGMSAATIAKEAQKLLNHPHIAPIIDEAKRDAIKHASWSRELAIERVMRVNDISFQNISDGDLSRDNFNSFFTSEVRLGELCDFEFQRDLMRQGIRNELEMLSPLCLMPKPTRKQIRNVIDNDDTKEKE